MNDKDIMILANLRSNARETLTSISQKTRVPISTIFDKLKTLEKDIITKHTTIIDFAKLGYSTRATITMRVDKSDKEQMRDFLEKHQNINTIYKINNGFDFLIETVFRNIRELEEFLEMLESRYKLKGLQVYYIIEDIKREAFLSEPDLVAII
jgi:DNA-binding Lrp family transcriptional regulator